jgi:uncharacterized protein (DUF3084 family)
MSKSKDAKEKDLCEQDEEFLEALNPLNNNQRHIVLDRLTETQHQTENERDRKWLKEVDKLYQKNKSCKEKIKELNKVCVKLIDEQRELQKENTELKEKINDLKHKRQK